MLQQVGCTPHFACWANMYSTLSPRTDDLTRFGFVGAIAHGNMGMCNQPKQTIWETRPTSTHTRTACLKVCLHKTIVRHLVWPSLKRHCTRTSGKACLQRQASYTKPLTAKQLYIMEASESKNTLRLLNIYWKITVSYNMGSRATAFYGGNHLYPICPTRGHENTYSQVP